MASRPLPSGEREAATAEQQATRIEQGDVLMSQSVMWKFLTAADLRAKAQAGAIVVLPVASMEQHGPHLPAGVDTILSEAVCQAAAGSISADTPVVVGPTPWRGIAEHHIVSSGTF